MAALKKRKNTQWEKAQQRINVSPLVSRISGKGSSCGTGFRGESLLEETVDACPGTLEAVGCFATGFAVKAKRRGGESKRGTTVKLTLPDQGLVMSWYCVSQIDHASRNSTRLTFSNAL